MGLNVLLNIEEYLALFGNASERARRLRERLGAAGAAEGAAEEGALDHFCNITLNDDPGVLQITYATLIISVILVLIGLVGNGINISIFAGSLRRNAASFYIFFLSASDVIFLIVQFLGFHLPLLKCFHSPHSSLDFVNHYEVLCEFWCYFMDLFHEYATALILAFTIERFIAVYYPMKVRQICTMKRTRILSLCLFVLIAIWIAPYHFIMISLQDKVCVVLSRWTLGWYVTYTIETFLFRIVPVVTIAVLNIGIILRVRQKQIATQENDEARKEQNRQMTVLLLLISAGHIVLYLPVAFHYLLWMLEREGLIDVSERGMRIARSCVETLDVAGCAENFFLYTLGSKMFRDELRQKLGCRKRT